MIYVFLADGFEEIEAIAPIDLLKRASKQVVTVGIGKDFVTGAHGISIQTDIVDMDVILSDELEMIVLPGGMPGTLNLEKSSCVQSAIDYCAKNDKYIAAICAAPSILGKQGLLKGKNATCFPGFEDFLLGASIDNQKICTDGKIITAKGAGVAVQFGLELVKIVAGEAKYIKIRDSIQCQ